GIGTEARCPPVSGRSLEEGSICCGFDVGSWNWLPTLVEARGPVLPAVRDSHETFAGRAVEQEVIAAAARHRQELARSPLRVAIDQYRCLVRITIVGIVW